MYERSCFVLFVVVFASVLAHRPPQEAREQITLLHNIARANVYPPAKDPIPNLNYNSDSLESTASSYANQCVWAHNANRGENVGENIAAFSGLRTADEEIVQLFSDASTSWESEKAGYTLDPLSQQDSCSVYPCGHYTQQIWAGTSQLGCGWKSCSENSPFGPSFPEWTIVVCNYAEAGNWLGEIPYVPALVFADTENNDASNDIQFIAQFPGFELEAKWTDPESEEFNPTTVLHPDEYHFRATKGPGCTTCTCPSKFATTTYPASVTQEIRDAIEFAKCLWSCVIPTHPGGIRLKVNAVSYGGNLLATAGPNLVSSDGVNWKYCPVTPSICVGVTTEDINMNVDPSDTFYYYGCDGALASNQIDFVSVIMHELGHGLGFSGHASNSNSGYNGLYAFDKRITRVYPSSTTKPWSALPITVSEADSAAISNALLFSGISYTNGQLYAPTTYQSGSSIYHWDETVYPAGNPNSLMTPSIGNSEVNHAPGLLTCDVLASIGYSPDVSKCSAGVSATPTPAAASASATRPAASASATRPAASASATRPAASASATRPAASASATRPAASASATRPAASASATRPAASASATRPAASASATQPAVSASATRPAASASATRPAASAGATRPAASASATRPAASASATRPAASASATRPAASASATRPAASASATRPAASASATQPAASASATRPAASASATRPAASASATRPAASASATRPAASASATRPAASASATRPAASASATRPAASASATQPAASASATRPAASASATRPAASASATRPAASASATRPAASATATPCFNTCPVGFCGQKTACGSTITCNCGSGQTCLNSVCQASGSTTPDWSGDFNVTFGTTPAIQIPDTVLSVSSYGKHIMPFKRSGNVMNKYLSKVNFLVTASSGEVGIGFRHTSGASSNNNMIAMAVSGIGTASTNMHYMIWIGDQIVWQATNTYSAWSTTGSNNITVTMTFDDATQNVYITWVQGNYQYQLYTSESNFPNLGQVALYTDTSSPCVPTFTKLSLATSTTLTVSLYQCIDTATWTSLFYQYTGANPATTSVQVRPSQQNANCAKQAIRAEQVVADSLTVVVESTGVASEIIGQTFLDLVSAGEAGPLAVSSAAIVGGTEGALAAGAPALSSSAVAAGGAGGAGAGGLSGGAIAGIVVGSVAGAVLAVGITAIVVGAVVVAAVVVANSRNSEESNPEEPTRAPELNRRSSVRQTLVNMFRAPRGGVDVMGNDPKSHQSISARSPAVKV